ncbi:flavin reductase family protein [Streptomyces sp. NPDC049881]|uniref:flavin reductase family protein n=1 Tax=Streptomyces sp. NPDC049881 TaxID=3155778 RepID=UPI0034354F10
MHETSLSEPPAQDAAHRPIDPAILYFGTPVVLLSTRNEDGTPNLAPFSSVFWLGRRAVLGIGARSATARNLLRTGECVLNLPSDDLVSAVDRLALTTAADPVPPTKARRGYRHVRDKFGRAGFGATPSETVAPPRVTECPVHMEALVRAAHPVAEDDPAARGGVIAFEAEVTRVHVTDALRLPGTADRIDPDAWRPLIMSFQQFYGLGPRLRPSTLATIDEELYR